MKCFIIDAKRRTVTEHQLPAGNNEILAFMQTVVGGSIESAVSFDEQIDGSHHCIFVDEEGMLKPIDHFFSHKQGHQPFAGNGIVVAYDVEGEVRDSELSAEYVASQITFQTVAEVRHALGI